MTLASPIDLTSFEDAIKRWFANSTGLTVIWADQSAPQPPYPFARLKVISGPVAFGPDDKRTSTDPHGDAGEEIEVEVCGCRDVTVSCQVYCSSSVPGMNAQRYIGIAQAALGLPSVLEDLRRSGVALVDSQPPQDLDFIAGGSFKSRANMDVRFRVGSSMTERTGYIASMTGTATVKNPDGTTAVAVNYGA